MVKHNPIGNVDDILTIILYIYIYIYPTVGGCLPLIVIYDYINK
jgi:hypothetical protein